MTKEFVEFEKCGHCMHFFLKAMKNDSQFGPHRLLYR